LKIPFPAERFSVSLNEFLRPPFRQVTKVGQHSTSLQAFPQVESYQLGLSLLKLFDRWYQDKATTDEDLVALVKRSRDWLDSYSRSKPLEFLLEALAVGKAAEPLVATTPELLPQLALLNERAVKVVCLFSDIGRMALEFFPGICFLEEQETDKVIEDDKFRLTDLVKNIQGIFKASFHFVATATAAQEVVGNLELEQAQQTSTLASMVRDVSGFCLTLLDIRARLSNMDSHADTGTLLRRFRSSSDKLYAYRGDTPQTVLADKGLLNFPQIFSQVELAEYIVKPEHADRR